MSLVEFMEKVTSQELLPYQRDLMEMIGAIPDEGKIVPHPRGLGLLIRKGDDFLRYNRAKKEWVLWV